MKPDHGDNNSQKPDHVDTTPTLSNCSNQFSTQVETSNAYCGQQSKEKAIKTMWLRQIVWEVLNPLSNCKQKQVHDYYGKFKVLSRLCGYIRLFGELQIHLVYVN